MELSWLRAASLGMLFWTSFSSGVTRDDVAFMTTATTTTTLQMKYYPGLVASLPSLQGKCVAITGTTSGLGYWTAIATARKGASCLIMLNRNSTRSIKADEEVRQAAAPGVDVITVTCDLENITSVRAAAASVNRITETYGGLDVLTLNAGIMGQPDTRTADGYDVMMQTNHLSHFLLAKLLLPALRAAATSRKDVRIVTQSSLTRGTWKLWEGGGPVNASYYHKSIAGSLGGDGASAARERYHQTKMANFVFAMAMHAKLQHSAQASTFKALSAAPGFSTTKLKIPPILNHTWIEHLIALSPPDGSCSMLMAMFSPEAKSGDFYEPKLLSTGPPIKVVSEGVVLPPPFPRDFVGIRDKELCAEGTLSEVWAASEAGLGERFVFPGQESLPVLV